MFFYGGYTQCNGVCPVYQASETHQLARPVCKIAQLPGPHGVDAERSPRDEDDVPKKQKGVRPVFYSGVAKTQRF
jgi:hypothetical protein